MKAEIPTENRDKKPVLRSQLNAGKGEVLNGFRALWRGKFWILLVTLITTFAGVYYATQIAVPKYTAKSSVALESREAQVVDLETVVSGLSGDQATINTEIEVLRSLGLIEKLVLQLDLVSDPEFNSALRPTPRLSLEHLQHLIFGVTAKAPTSDRQTIDAAIRAVLSAISVSNLRNSYVFNIEVITTDPYKSAEIANTLAELYILDQLEGKFEATEQATAWLSARVSELQSELQAANALVKELSARSTLVSAEALEGLNRQIKDARARGESLRNELSRHASRLTELQDALATGERGTMAQIANDETLNRIVTSQASDETFMARFNLIEQRARLEVDRTTAQANTLEISISQLEADYNQQSEDLVKLQQLKREANASQLIYEYFLGRLKETSVQVGIQQADSRILSRAAVPYIASQPQKSRIVAFAILIGAMLGVALVFIRERMQTGFRTAESVEHFTGFPVIGQVPTIPARLNEQKLRYLVDKPTSAVAEAVRNLRTSVLLTNVEKPPQVIMFTSSIPGEGKTIASMALAQNFSGMGKRVLLIEGDIRKCVFKAYFDLKSDEGILGAISDTSPLKELAQPVPYLGVDVMIGERSSTNAADVFSSDKFKAFLREARAQYDIIIIDTPPVLVVPDARIIAQNVDAVLYGVHWDKTSRTQVAIGLGQLEAVGVQVAGVVLLRIDPKGMKRYGYGDRYGAYSTYGRGYYEN